MNLKPVKDKNGKIVQYDFKPTPEMILYAQACALPENRSLTNEAVALKAGVSLWKYRKWHTAFITEQEIKGKMRRVNLFREWLTEYLAITKLDYKEALKMVGRERALDGDFKFWKEEAATEGVIRDDTPQANIYNIPINLNDARTISEIERARDQLLEANKALDEPQGPEVVETTAEVQEESGD